MNASQMQNGTSVKDECISDAEWDCCTGLMHLRCRMGLLYRINASQMQNGTAVKDKCISDAEWDCCTG